MSENNKQIFRRWFKEVWCEGREATIDELCSTTVVAYGLGDVEPVIHSPAEFKDFWRNLRGAIPNIQINVEDLIAEGDKVVGRVVVSGVHTGAHLGIPPSGKTVHLKGIVVLRIANGQIAEAWNSWDQLGLLRQTGALATPSQDRFMARNA